MILKRTQKRISFYAGLSYTTGRIIGHLCSQQNSEETVQFLEEIKRHYPEGNILLIWDNASWHKSDTIKQWLQENPGIVTLMNFPVYSPNLNPIEHVWKEMKRYLSEKYEGAPFTQIIDSACGYLLGRIFPYTFS
jgi:hypothetical protein